LAADSNKESAGGYLMRSVRRIAVLAFAVIAASIFVCVSAAAAEEGGPSPETSEDAYVSPYTAARVESGATDESNPYALLARSEWLKQVYGANPPSDFGTRLFQELQNQQSSYPGQVAGAQTPAGIPVWQSIGPTRDVRTFNGVKLHVVDSGRLRVILPHPTDPNTVYVLSSGGGVWKTTDFTDPHPTWVPKTDGIFTTSGGSMAFGRDPNTLYLGLGDPFEGQPLAGGVMLRSTDGGNTWTPAPFINLPGAGLVTDVKVDSSQAQDIVMAGTNHGLFRSTDGGSTYSQVTTIPTKSTVWSLAQTSAGWLASSEEGTFEGHGTLYLSTDHGATWQPISNAGHGYSGAGRTTLGVGAPTDSVVYAFAGNPEGVDQADLFRSADGGQTWTPLHLNTQAPTNPNPQQPNMDLMHRQAFYNQMILVGPSDASRNTVYLGGNLHSAKSTDGGRTWTLLTNWLALFGLQYAHADFHTAAFSSAGGSPTILFGTDGGLAISTDSGASFSTDKNEGLVDTEHYSLATDPTHSQSVVTGLQDAGTRLRQGSTSTFDQPLGGDGLGTAWSQANGEVVMGSVFFDGIFSSTFSNPNQPKKWALSVNGIERADASFFTALTSPSPAADPSGQVFYTTSEHHIYQTTDGGSSWHSILDLTGTPLVVRAVLNPLGISPLDTNHVAAASNGGRILITTDGGQTWKAGNLNKQVPGWASFNSTVAWANDNVLYAANVSPFPRPRVAKSTDGGVHWKTATSGLPNVPVYHLLVSPADATANTVYAATFLGVYQTTDGGQSWHLFGSGLPAVQVYALYMPPDGSFLRIATYGRGIWQITP
jgi:photosystem II stability/assembly factor-like uncharacterized protein